MNNAARILERLSSGANTIALWGTTISVMVMVFAALWQALARYVLASPPAWTEELARYAMVWCGMLGASCAFRIKADPALFPTRINTTGALGLLWASVRMVGVILFAAPVLYRALFGPGWNPARGYIARLITRHCDTMDISLAWFGVAIPIAFTLILLHLTAEMVNRVNDLKSQSGEAQ